MTAPPELFGNQRKPAIGFLIGCSFSALIWLGLFLLIYGCAATGAQSNPPDCLFVGSRTVTMTFVAPGDLKQACARLGAVVDPPLQIRGCAYENSIFLPRPGKIGAQTSVVAQTLWHEVGHVFGDGTTPLRRALPPAVWDARHQPSGQIPGCT
ncbi:MAG: hypothetical protein COA84_12820 [Robiginitomaculum sp.]|nr:MAG: hypothetical protein COA84_12820 [Robiginitomaculum sp.]